MREVVTEKFKEFIFSQANSIENVAVVGGNSEDPEVATVSRQFPDAEFHYFNINNSNEDSNFHTLDINKVTPQSIENMQFDIVVSSQVLEHIWNHHNYFKLLVAITKPRGLIWLNCPKSNMVHGSPDYFSAGFTASYLSRNLEHHGCEILLASEVGNRRYYLGIHFARYWQTLEENRHPLWKYRFAPGSFLGVLRKFIRNFPSRVLLSLVRLEDPSNNDFATESMVGARKT
jgi:SAM-dependent methyltransferase